MKTLKHALITWANGRLASDMETIEHIEKYGFVPHDGRPHMLQCDLAMIVDILGDFADEQPQIKRIRAFFKKYGIEEISYSELFNVVLPSNNA